MHYVDPRRPAAIVVNTGDPRLHVFETVVRERAINLDGKENVRVEGITPMNEL